MFQQNMYNKISKNSSTFLASISYMQNNQLLEKVSSSICTSRVMADLGRKWSKFQKSISQKIFNRSSPDFYPHWTLAVCIQSHCWNYPATSRFGQTEDTKFSVDFEFDLKKQVKVNGRQVSKMASYGCPFLRSFIKIRS